MRNSGCASFRVIDRPQDPFGGFRYRRAEWFFHATSKRDKSDALLRGEGSTIRIFAINGPPRLSPCLVCAQQVTQSHSYIYVYIQFNFSTRETYSAQDQLNFQDNLGKAFPLHHRTKNHFLLLKNYQRIDQHANEGKNAIIIVA